MNGWHLSTLPLSARVFCTLFLVGIGCGSLAAFVQASTAVGLSPAAVEASLAREMPMTHMQMHHGQMSGEKEITPGEISSAAKVWIRTPLLIQTSHTHLFGQTLIAGLLGLIFLFASVREWLKAAIITPPVVLMSDRDAVAALLSGARRFYVREFRLSPDERQAVQRRSGWSPDED